MVLGLVQVADQDAATEDYANSQEDEANRDEVGHAELRISAGIGKTEDGIDERKQGEDKAKERQPLIPVPDMQNDNDSRCSTPGQHAGKQTVEKKNLTSKTTQD